MRNLKRILLLLLILSLAVFSVVGLNSCLGEEEPEEEDPNENTYPEDDLPLEGLVLIRKNIAQFKVVIASGAGSEGRRAANELVELLRDDLGVEISDAVEDKKAEDVSDCEIIIGTGCKNRPDACNVSAEYLGPEGYVFKVVGTRIVIAGGTGTLTRSAVNKFVEEELGVTDATTSLRNVAVNKSLKVEVLTKYEIDSLKIGSNDLSKFVLACDMNDHTVYPSLISSVQNTLKLYTGDRLSIVDLKDCSASQRKIVIRSLPFDVHKDGNRTYKHGFYTYVKNGDLYIECEYKNVFEECLDEFISTYVTSKKGNVTIPANLNKSKHVSTVSYCTYGGAKGDGKTNDFLAMLKTHEFANSGGQKVVADEGKTFYVSTTYRTVDGVSKAVEIPVMTDCDFGVQVHSAGDIDVCSKIESDDPKLYRDTPNFIIDDTSPEIYPISGYAIFKFCRDNSMKGISVAKFEEAGLLTEVITEGEGEDAVQRSTFVMPDGSSVVRKGQTKIEWLAPYVTEKSMVIFYNSEHRDYIRYGANQNSGAVRRDFVILDENGNVDPTTPVIFEFERISGVNVVPINDNPITINGGYFETIANKTHDSIEHTLNGEPVTYTDHRNVYHEYRRGFKIERSNVTFTNVRHKMRKGSEASAGYYKDPSDNKWKYSTKNGGYPYYGFLFFNTASNVDVIDCDLTGHIVYYEDKSEFTNDTGTASAGVPMGTYDFVIEYSNDIVFNGVEMRGTDIADSSYWGIMSSNGSKNLEFSNCKISRIDAHRGFWNMKIDNTVIGHTLNIVGGGTLEITNTQRRTGASFMSLRGDYGATFEGNMILKNCLLDAIKSFRSQEGGVRDDDKRETTGYIINSGFKSDTANYLNWKFGYTCYMPENVTIENFVSKATGTTYVFNKLVDGAFNASNVTQYQITKKINYVTNNSSKPSFNGTYTTNKTRYPIAPSGASKLNAIAYTETTK